MAAVPVVSVVQGGISVEASEYPVRELLASMLIVPQGVVYES